MKRKKGGQGLSECEKGANNQYAGLGPSLMGGRRVFTRFEAEGFWQGPTGGKGAVLALLIRKGGGKGRGRAEGIRRKKKKSSLLVGGRSRVASFIA